MAQFPELVPEGVTLSEPLLVGTKANSATVPEGVELSDTPLKSARFAVLLGDLFEAVDTEIANQRLNQLSGDGVSLSDSEQITARRYATLADAIIASDTALLGLGMALFDAALLNDAVAVNQRLRPLLADVVLFSDSYLTQGEHPVLVDETVRFLEDWAVSAKSRMSLFDDGVLFSDQPSPNVGAYLSEGIDLSETADELRKAYSLIEELALLSDQLTVKQRLGVLVRSGVTFGAQLLLAGDEYDAYVLNTRTFAPWQYSGFGFNSFTDTGLAARDDGIYRLEGDTDDGEKIAAHFITGLTDLGSPRQKRIPYVYLGYTSNGKLVLKVEASDTDDDQAHWYELTEDRVTEGQARFKVGRGLRGRYWQFRIENADGADFDLDDVQLVPVLLRRRI